MSEPMLLAALVAICGGAIGASAATVSGHIENLAPTQHPVLLQALRNPVLHGQAVPTSKEQLYEVAGLAAVVRADPAGDFNLDLPAGESYSFFAFQDSNGNQKYDPDLFEACGWWSGASGQWWLAPVLVESSIGNLSISLKHVVPLPAGGQEVDGGSLRKHKGHTVLHLKGNATARGFAHGRLLAAQIIQFFRFFTLEETTGSRGTYSEHIQPLLQSHYTFDPEYLAEAQGMLDGIAASGVDSFIPELGRRLQRADILYLNDYGLYPQNGHATDGVGPVPVSASPTLRQPLNVAQAHTRRGASACTQFALWGNSTAGSDVGGGMIAGRNMDGENDLRRLTVSNLMIFAVEPADGLRFVHFFWPGFIGSASGANEKGVYFMMNDGQSNPSAELASNVSSLTWAQRAVLSSAHSVRDIPAILSRFEARVNSTGRGGVCGSGCNLFAVGPASSTGGRPGDGRDGSGAPAFVYEGDRFGGVYRRPGDYPEPHRALDSPSERIMATNHFLRYGYDAQHPLDNFGYQVYFSSLWRYEAGKNKLNAWSQLGSRQRQGKLGTQQMIELLQTVTHGTTEHSVIWYPEQRVFRLAVASPAGPGWHAPYESWTVLAFDDLFRADSAADQGQRLHV